MIEQLLLATVMVVITAATTMHRAGIAGLARASRFDPAIAKAHHHFSPRLFTFHGIEIWRSAAPLPRLRR